MALFLYFLSSVAFASSVWICMSLSPNTYIKMVCYFDLVLCPEKSHVSNFFFLTIISISYAELAGAPIKNIAFAT
jgi:hypothetical protein